MTRLHRDEAVRIAALNEAGVALMRAKGIIENAASVIDCAPFTDGWEDFVTELRGMALHVNRVCDDLKTERREVMVRNSATVEHSAQTGGL